MKVDMSFDDLKKLIKDESKAAVNPSIIKVSRKQLLDQLNESKADVERKHNESLKLWRKAMHRYQEFINKNPGSKQMDSPGEVPAFGENYEKIKSYMRIIASMSEETLVFDINFLKEIFNIMVYAATEARVTRDNFATAYAGTIGLQAFTQ